MATLPPRKNPTPIRISKQNVTPMQTLLQMGFPKHRAEKALAATGHRSVQLASDWLLAHVNDPFLDECEPREYILYACPTGSFLKQLEQFWLNSKNQYGWNGAHNFVPHITLVSFFKAPDECATQLSKALKQIVDLAGIQQLNQPLSLELYTSQNFMGFFVKDDDANYLKRLALQYVKEVSSSTISLEPHVKSLHLTLAYQFSSNQFNSLKSMVEKLDPSNACDWELRLYSRDPRLSTKQVHSVLYPHTPLESDELELRIGDYVYLNSDALENSTDGWVDGVSWLTGTNGYLPENYTNRTAESDAWTLHNIVPIRCSKEKNNIINGGGSSGADIVDSVTVSGGGAGAGASFTTNDVDSCSTVTAATSVPPSNDNDSNEDNITKSTTNVTATAAPPPPPSEQNKLNENSLPPILDVKTVELLIRQSALCDLSKPMDIKGSVNVIDGGSSNKSRHQISSTSSGAATSDNRNNLNNNRQIYIMRHGERVDFTFGPWIPYCFDEAGNYSRKDLNMPTVLPPRVNSPAAWAKDSPLTNIGVHQAALTGQSLKESNAIINYVYCSPSYRCIQTCSAMLDGMGIRDKCKIRIENGLFEWMMWYPDDMPEWCTKEELTNGGFNMDLEYSSLFSREKISAAVNENCEEFYQRNNTTVEHILKIHDDGNILIVGHAASLDTCSRQLSGLPIRTHADMNRIMQKVTYCSLVLVEQFEDGWKLCCPPCYPLTHNKNSRFDWKIITT